MARILVAEADPFFSKFYTMKLRQLDYVVDRVQDGKEALEKLQNQPYDAVLMNLMLPYQDGFSLLKERENTPNKETPVVVVTDLRQEQDQKKASDLGVQHYFIKNEMQTSDLFKALQSLVKSSSESA